MITRTRPTTGMLSLALLLAASTFAHASAGDEGWISIQRHLGPSRPPTPVERPLLSLEDRSELLALPCVAGVGALTPERVTLLGRDGAPHRITRWHADASALKLLGLRPDPGTSSPGRWLTRQGAERLGFGPARPSPDRLTQRLDLLGGVAPSGQPYVDEALPVSGVIDAIRTAPLRSAALIEGPSELLLPAKTVLSREQRVTQAMPPLLLVHTRTRTGDCMATVKAVTDAWAARARIELRVVSAD